MTDGARWVIDTSAYTHLSRAGHADLLRRLAPGGIVVVPTYVSDEIEEGRLRFPRIPAISDASWASPAVLTDAEDLTVLELKADRGGLSPLEHLGECAVIACAKHRGMVAILDERDAVRQAEERGVRTHDTLWIVIEAYKKLLHRDRAATGQIVDDLLETDMWLPIASGESLLAWAYEESLLP